MASLSSATKIVGNDMSTSSLPKPSSQVAMTIAPATQTAAAKSAVGGASATQTTAAAVSLSLAAKSSVGNEVSPASPAVSAPSAPSQQPVRTPACNKNLFSLQKCPGPRKLLAGESVHKTMYVRHGWLQGRVQPHNTTSNNHVRE